MRVLVVGGTGLIGLPVVKKIISCGYEVITVARHFSGEIPQEVVQLIGDIRNFELMKKKLKDLYFDVVIDFLSFNPSQLQSTLELVSGCCGQYVFISSSAVYRYEEGIINEDTAVLGDGRRKYSMDKVSCESLIKELCERECFPYTIVRPGIIYGKGVLPYGLPYPNPGYGKHWVIIQRILEGKPILLPRESAGESHVFTYADDFASWIYQLIGNEDAHCQTVHVLGQRWYTWKELLLAIYKTLGKEPHIIEIPLCELSKYLSEDAMEEIRGRIGRRHFVYDYTRLRKLAPASSYETTMENAVSEIVNAYLVQSRHSYDLSFDALCDRILSAQRIHTYCETRVSSGFINYNRDLKNMQKLAYYYIYFGINKTFIGKIINRIKRYV